MPYRALHLLGEHGELGAAGVLIGIEEIPVQNPEVAVVNLLDGHVSIWKMPVEKERGCQVAIRP